MDSGPVALNGKRWSASAQKQKKKEGNIVKNVAKVSEMCGCGARQHGAGRIGKVEICKEKIVST